MNLPTKALVVLLVFDASVAIMATLAIIWLLIKKK